MTQRQLSRTFESIPASDGAGVKLRRSIGAQPSLRLDPFLMLDEFFSDDPDDYLAGFPEHPHRGFETVTYMLDGHMQHKDHLGNTGDLGPGDVQWMTAARGIIHSEMPQQTEGRMRGFQLWLNLPANRKMQPARYRDIPSAQIPVAEPVPGATVHVIAGRTPDAEGAVITGPASPEQTDPLYLDLRLDPGAAIDLPIPPGHNAMVYVYDGSLALDGGTIEARHVGILGDGDHLSIPAQAGSVRCLVLAGRPLDEPIVQYGPFVMNSSEEIEQALRDYRDGTLAA